jgi:hypothetical protein
VLESDFLIGGATAQVRCLCLCGHIREPRLLVRGGRLGFCLLVSPCRALLQLEDGGDPISYEEVKLILIGFRENVIRF